MLPVVNIYVQHHVHGGGDKNKSIFEDIELDSRFFLFFLKYFDLITSWPNFPFVSVLFRIQLMEFLY